MKSQSSSYGVINPYYAARLRPSRAPVNPDAMLQRQQRVLYAKLPMAPINTSPVPHLTSLYHFDRAGEYGNRKYPGNCGGNIIKDLLLYFQPSNVFDPLCYEQHNGSSVALIVMWP